MVKRTITSHADERPRIHFRLVDGQPQVAGNPSGPWTDTADLIAAIDSVAGEDAHQRPAIIIWEGNARG